MAGSDATIGGTRPSLARRMGRHLAIAAVIYPTLFLTVMLMAIAACYLWPWLLDPVTP